MSSHDDDLRGQLATLDLRHDVARLERTSGDVGQRQMHQNLFPGLYQTQNS